MAKTKVSAERIVEVFCETIKAGGTMKEVAKKLDMSVQATYQRIYYYRKMGVKLPPIKPVEKRKRVNVNSLNKMVKLLMK